MSVKSSLFAFASKDIHGHLGSLLTLNEIGNASTDAVRYFAKGNWKPVFGCNNYMNSLCVNLMIQITLKEDWPINSNRPI